MTIGESPRAAMCVSPVSRRSWNVIARCKGSCSIRSAGRVAPMVKRSLRRSSARSSGGGIYARGAPLSLVGSLRVPPQGVVGHRFAISAKASSSASLTHDRAAERFSRMDSRCLLLDRRSRCSCGAWLRALPLRRLLRPRPRHIGWPVVGRPIVGRGIRIVRLRFGVSAGQPSQKERVERDALCRRLARELCMKAAREAEPSLA